MRSSSGSSERTRPAESHFWIWRSTQWESAWRSTYEHLASIAINVLTRSVGLPVVLGRSVGRLVLMVCLSVWNLPQASQVHCTGDDWRPLADFIITRSCTRAYIHPPLDWISTRSDPCPGYNFTNTVLYRPQRQSLCSVSTLLLRQNYKCTTDMWNQGVFLPKNKVSYRKQMARQHSWSTV